MEGGGRRDGVQTMRVAVIGMGASGTAVAALLAREGADVRLIDDKIKDIPTALRDQAIQYRLGTWTEEDLLSSDQVVVSPGFPLRRLPLARLRASDIPVIGEMEWAASRLSAPIIAITGTNGKSTTTTLIGEMLKAWGMRVFVGGNLGTPLCEAVGGEWDFIVVEVSSFQLEAIDRFHPRIAALLNVTPDHLDRYPDFDAYQQAKWRIFENQTSRDHAVLNADMPTPPGLRCTPAFFSRKTAPAHGVFLRDGEIVAHVLGEPMPILRTAALRIGGTHNMENAMAAVACALLCGAPVSAIGQVLGRFEGLPHRMEFVREVGGARYINDSKGTNVGAVIQSLAGLVAPVILIAGGQDKGCDFAPLRAAVAGKVKRLILLGEAQEKMAHALSGGAPIDAVKSMEDAVAVARAHARLGDVVLLSPACASFDLFRDYKQRGEVFRAAVNGLADSAKGTGRGDE